MIFLHYHSTQEGGYKHDGEHTCDGISVPVKLPTGQQAASEWQHKGEHECDGGWGKDGVDDGVDRHLCKQTLPLALLLTMSIADSKLVERLDKFVRQMLFKFVIGRCSQSNHVWRKEGSDNRHCHYYRIKELSDNAKRQSQRCNDERELTYLRHRKSTAYSRL